jgi:hypothetical protein
MWLTVALTVVMGRVGTLVCSQMSKVLAPTVTTGMGSKVKRT